MPMIQIEQDNTQLQDDAREMIRQTAENISQSFDLPEPQGGIERIVELTTVTAYLRTLEQQALLSPGMYQVLQGEWEVARSAALDSAPA